MNILTTEQKDTVKKIYTKKVIIIILWMLSFVSGIFLIAITPLYFQLSEQSILLEEKIINIQSSELAALQSERNEAITEANNLLGLFQSSKDSPQEYVRKIVEDFEGVEISEISTNYQDKKISFVGTATTRKAFVDMTNILQEASWAEGVEVPVSNFTKSRDIPFSLSLTLKSDVYVD